MKVSVEPERHGAEKRERSAVPVKMVQRIPARKGKRQKKKNKNVGIE